MKNIMLRIVSPFSFYGTNSIFCSNFAQSPGIYLWIIKQKADNSHLIHYVGETTFLTDRHCEHLIQILGLNYGIFDPDKSQHGVCDIVWPGLCRDKTEDGPIKQIEAYQNIHSTVIRYLSIINIFFAQIEIETYLRKHIEGCIGWNLHNNHPNDKILYPDDNRVGTKSEKDVGQLIIASLEIIRGLDLIIQY